MRMVTQKRLPLLAIGSLLLAFIALLASPFSGVTYAKTMQQQSANIPQLGTYGLPAWWNYSNCDDTAYFKAVGVHSYQLTTAWRGIQICGPLPYTVKTPDHYVTFPGGSTEQEFECTELVKRYLYLAYNVNAIGGTSGYQVVDRYTSAYPNLFHKVTNDGSVHMAPAEGDVFSYGSNDPGHTSIVVGSSINSSGTGSISVVEQNVETSGRATLQMTNWVILHDPNHIGTVANWMTTRAVPTTVNFSLNLSGIGTNTSVGLNNNPRRPTRTAAIQIRNASNQTVQSFNTSVSYNYNTGLYNGSVTLTGLTSGQYYNITVKLDNTLNKMADNWFQPGGTITQPTLLPLSGDVDSNNVIDILDYNDIMACWYPAKYGPCHYPITADLNDDGKVDQIDYNIIIRSFSGVH